jgi:hypothetical protein
MNVLKAIERCLIANPAVMTNRQFPWVVTTYRFAQKHVFTNGGTEHAVPESPPGIEWMGTWLDQEGLNQIPEDYDERPSSTSIPRLVIGMEIYGGVSGVCR